MNGADADQLLETHLRALRTVIAGLLAGAAVLATVAVVVRMQGQMPPTPAVPIMSYVAVGMGVIMLAARAVVPSAKTAGARKTLPADVEVPLRRWLGLYQTQMIVGAALLEGATFMFFISYLVEGVPWTLAGGALFWLLLAVLQFPTRDGVERWVEAQREALQQERMGV